MLKAKEKSSYCSRNCLSNDTRPMDIIFYNLTNNVENKCLKLTKDCTCSCLCLNWPTYYVHYEEEGNSEYIGKIIDNFDFVNYSFSIKDENEKLLYWIYGSCC